MGSSSMSNETQCKDTTFPQITRQYDVKVSKKTRFGRSDAGKTEEFGLIEAVRFSMMKSWSAERGHFHRKVGTRSAKWGLLGRAEAMRRAQRRQMYGTKGTNPAWKVMDKGSDFMAEILDSVAENA